jgi:hypothetical protein
MTVNKDKALAELQRWREMRRRYRLTNAQVEMARELVIRPDHLLQTLHVSEDSGCELLGACIVTKYRERFGKTCPARVRSIRELERELREGKKSRQRPDRPEDDAARRQQVEATRVALLTLKRLKMGGSD